jgi:hypothetical protein
MESLVLGTVVKIVVSMHTMRVQQLSYCWPAARLVLPQFRLEAGSEPKLVTSYDRSRLQFSSAMTGCLPNGLSVGEP